MKTDAGFTFPELLIALLCSSFILASLIGASLVLQRSFDATERFSSTHMAASRVLDYLEMDFRRSRRVEILQGSSRTVYSSALSSFSGVLSVSGSTCTLIFTEPAYYLSNQASSSNYRLRGNLITTASNGLAYSGTASGIAYADSSGNQLGNIEVRYYVTVSSAYGTYCIMRDEASISTGTSLSGTTYTSKPVAENVINLGINFSVNNQEQVTLKAEYVPSYSQRGGTMIAQYELTKKSEMLESAFIVPMVSYR